LFSPLRSRLSFSRGTYRFSRPPSRLTLIAAAAAAGVLAIVVVAVALASGSPAPGQGSAALAAATSARVGSLSGPSGTGHGAQPKTPAPQGHAPAGQAPASHAAPAAAPAPAPQPFLIYDSVTPQTIPGNPVVATYADGPHPDSPSQVAAFSRVLWIDISASDPNANALDIEPGCASPSQAAGWVYNRLTAHPHAVAILYTYLSAWPQVQADVSGLPAWMKSRIRWWIADPTGTPHIVPGSQATQWYWGQNYDISTALPGF
jgi:hypothetical protein